MGTPDVEAHQRHWLALTGSQHGHPIALTPDVSLELVPGEHLLIESLSLSVRSLPVARAFLISRQLLQADTGDVLSVACDGLQVHLVEACQACLP